MNRRDFLRATLATSALTTAGVLAADSPSRPRLKLGFLGASHSHASGKVKAVQDSADWELIGICEEKEKARESYQKQGVRLLSQTELLDSAQVVVVESDVKDHYRHARAALSAGKHVHLEKAPTDSLATFRELVDLAKSKGVLLQMGYMWRYHPGINTALEAARKGWLGEVTLVRGTINSQIAAAQRKELAAFRGGGMFELGCHLIDPLIRLLGRPDKVTPLLRKHGHFDDDLNDNCVALFEFPKAIGEVTVNLMQSGASSHRSFEIVGSGGTVRIQPIEQPTLTVDLAKPAGPYTAKSQTVKLPSYQRYVPELADFADAIRNRRPLAVTPQQDLLVHEALLRACNM